MRKFISILLALTLLTGILSGCGQSAAAGDSGQMRIVTTIFPEYDWVRQILGDQAENAEITILLRSGVDLHSYQPTAEDIIQIAGCDLFLYVGGESDAWAEDALAQTANDKRVVVKLMDVLSDCVVEEEIVEGMAHDHEAEDAEEARENDEHVWLSLRNAQIVCRHLAQRLGELDSDNAAVYSANAERYVAELAALDERYQAVVNDAAFDTLLFADRFPFRYLAEDYGISYYAAFSGCSAETEASFETIAFLADKAATLNLPAVMIIDGSDGSIANTVIQTAGTNQKILSLNSMQSVTSADVQAGTTYLSIMEQNLEVLKDALN